MSSDKTFITNEEGNKLEDRLNFLLKRSDFFDCLVGYFYITGFYKLQDQLEDIGKIRILIGMGVDFKTFEALKMSKKDNVNDRIPSAHLKDQVSENIIEEMDNSPDMASVEGGIRKFISWIRSGKLEIKAYKKRSIHSKLYIMTLDDEQVSDGHVITGSSNLTAPSLDHNLEFNVELKNSGDFNFAKEKFNELWDDAVDVTEDYVNTLSEKTWLNDSITPYELYLKFIYEYLFEKINNDIEDFDHLYRPKDFNELQYQLDAVSQAKEIIKEHNGVFLSDVVGLGKTYMGALLLQQLKGGSVVIAPPALIDKHNPGGWYRVLQNFEITNFEVVSIGKLEDIEKDDIRYQNVLIDESHLFRNEDSERYSILKRICRRKNVILVSATPFNNKPEDLLSQIKLFQDSHNSTLPNPKVSDLDKYFKSLRKKLNKYDKVEQKEDYERVSNEITADLRENVLQHIMVRRTRQDISKNYSKDLQRNNMEFPKVNKPQPIYYEFDEKLDKIFDESLDVISKQLTFARYMPLSEQYSKNPLNNQSQKNMVGFIKVLFMKRLESGIAAFKKTINTAVTIHQQIVKTFKEKKVFYTSKSYIKKIYELMENDDLDAIEEMINEGKEIKAYAKSEFKPAFIRDIKHDLELLKYVQDLWEDIIEYPKNEKLIELLKTDEFKDKKVILFTEFVDTADFLEAKIKEELTPRVMKYTGNSKKDLHEIIIKNFDANVSDEKQEDDYDILIATDVLSHGVNLHRSNIIINYDIPWNPTKIMQRVGRVERLGTKFDEINIYNFLPTTQIEDAIGIEQIAEDKINKFINLLGNDSQLLTEEPILSHDLFNKINGQQEDEDDEEIETELQYLREIRDIRDDNPELYKKIEQIPKKARVTLNGEQTELITLLRSNKFKKILKTTQDGKTEEIDFLTAAKQFKSKENEIPQKTDEQYYEYLNKNINSFKEIINKYNKQELSRPEKNVLNLVKFVLSQKSQLNTYDRNYFIKLEKLIKQGTLSNNEIKKIQQQTKGEKNIQQIRYKISQILNYDIMNTKIRETKDENFTEVMLSEYTIGD